MLQESTGSKMCANVCCHSPTCCSSMPLCRRASGGGIGRPKLCVIGESGRSWPPGSDACVERRRRLGRGLMSVKSSKRRESSDLNSTSSVFCRSFLCFASHSAASKAPLRRFFEGCDMLS